MVALWNTAGQYIFAIRFLYSLLLFFLAKSQRPQIGCLSYFYTWCGPSANLECGSEMCCMRTRWKCRTQKTTKIRHLGSIAQLCRTMSSQLRHVSTIEKNLLNSNISSTCPYNMVNFVPPEAEIVRSLGAPQQISTGLVSLLKRRRSTEANQTLHDVWPSPDLVHHIYIFRGSCPVTEFCHVQNSLCVQVLRSPIFAALLHGTRVVGVSQTLRR